MAKIYGQNSIYLESKHLLQNKFKWLFKLFNPNAVLGTFRNGQIGEWDVKVELAKLSDNYSIYCDVKLPKVRANIDFILSGPKGFFVIEVKNWKYIHRNSHLENAINQTQKNAIMVQNYLRSKSSVKVNVKGLLVFSSDNAWKINFHSDKYVTSLNKRNLNQYILNKNDISYQSEVVRLEDFLRILVQHNAVARSVLK